MYRSKDIQRIAKLGKDKLVHWTRIGIIQPYENAEGRGSRRIYSYQNLIEVIICRELNQLGVEPKIMRVAIGMLNTHTWYEVDFKTNKPKGKKFCFMEEAVKGTTKISKEQPSLIITNRGIFGYHIAEKKKIGEYLAGSNSAIVVNLARIVKEASAG